VNGVTDTKSNVSKRRLGEKKGWEKMHHLNEAYCGLGQNGLGRITTMPFVSFAQSKSRGVKE